MKQLRLAVASHVISFNQCKFLLALAVASLANQSTYFH